MRVLFWGTPEFATAPLRALLGEGFDVAAVVTQPDKPAGRSRSSLHASAVKQVAVAEGIPVLQPEKPRGDEFLEQLRTMMVVEPERYFDDFVAAGATGLTIHAEVSPHLQRQLTRIRELGCAAGVALNPSTPLSAVEDVLGDLDLLLVMSVNPGFGGQQFIPASLDKVARARRMR